MQDLTPGQPSRRPSAAGGDLASASASAWFFSLSSRSRADEWWSGCPSTHFAPGDYSTEDRANDESRDQDGRGRPHENSISGQTTCDEEKAWKSADEEDPTDANPVSA